MTERPGPAKHDDHATFWEGTQADVLLVQQCARCATVRWPPRILCGSCLSDQAVWVPAPTTGTLFSWTVVHHTTVAGFRDEVPYAVGLVELATAGGTVRMLGGIKGCAPDELAVGQTVVAQFDHTDEATLVNWVVQPEMSGTAL